MKVIYNSEMFGFPELGIQDDPVSPMYGWLFYHHPDGQWVSLANVRQEIISMLDEKKKCRCGKMFNPTYGEHNRCPDCLASQHSQAERATGVE